MIEAVIFDMGGVLAYDVWEHLLLNKEEGLVSIYDLDLTRVQKVGRELYDEFAHRKGQGEDGWKELEEEYWNRLTDRLHLSLAPSELIQLTDRFIRPVVGMIELLECLKARAVRLAICSNNTEFWFRRQADKLGLYRFFNAENIVLSSRIGVSKSSPNFEMFRAVVNRLGIDKRNCVFVDDRIGNIVQSIKFGLAGIIFPSHSEYGAEYLGLLLVQLGIL